MNEILSPREHLIQFYLNLGQDSAKKTGRTVMPYTHKKVSLTNKYLRIRFNYWECARGPNFPTHYNVFGL